MSYGRQGRNTESWSNDPNNFSNTGNRFGGNARNDPSMNPSGQDFVTDDPTSQARVNPDPGSTSWDQSPDTPRGQQSGNNQFGDHWTAARGDNYGTTDYQGNTSSIDNPGAGGDFGATGRGSGAGAGQMDQDGAGQRDQGYAPSGGGSGQGTGQPSLGQRLKGTTEKLAGHLMGDTSKVQHGEARKTGGDQTGTNW
ncbi:hypothetical protein OBBRIDRAFT_798432 [Obba rivulosa]|uniref:Uncharacterized protein n=1 Tax=Obba rivulosa TaxID=1052685 RepID=A0A8E2ANF8_9APHY|nr:hypothetical protein OBBRIDRAFT_798432 [Obba rivulosa]